MKDKMLKHIKPYLLTLILILPTYLQAQILSTSTGQILSTSTGQILVAEPGTQTSAVTVTTLAISSVSISESTVNYSISADVTSTISDCGIVWSSTAHFPDLSKKLGNQSAGTNAGNFSSAITGLNPNTAYYARAYAVIDGVTYYGVPLYFKTKALVVYNCGEDLTITHNASNGIAPVDATISYHTARTDLSGTEHCWITQNLGAVNEVVGLDDLSNANSGWYWQFNKKQGYKPGSVTSWNNSITENSNWHTDNDPCTQELGESWRIPTYTEWMEVKGRISDINAANASPLKLHLSGCLFNGNGSLFERGQQGSFWSSTQITTGLGYFLKLDNTDAQNPVSVSSRERAFGFPIRCIKDNEPKPFTSCGSAFTVNHVCNDIAPETKQVTYETISTNLSGTSQCWITRNLGADRQANSPTDNDPAAAGWYWQFNRKRGYINGPTPAWVGAGSDQSGDWQLLKDPCASELGNGWRIPTYSEWFNVDAVGQWFIVSDAYYSVLELHTGGDLRNSDGLRTNLGSIGSYWSSTKSDDNTSGYRLIIHNGLSNLAYSLKAEGMQIRCLKDNPVVPFSACGDLLTVNHQKSSGSAPVDISINYRTVSTSLTGKSQCWIGQNLGATNPIASSVLDATDGSAGWYWQFNQKKGFNQTNMIGFQSSLTQTSVGWEQGNDPCQELGAGWRIPTKTEWEAVGQGWTSKDDAYNSVLKLHNGGEIYTTDGEVKSRMLGGFYWSSTHYDASRAWLFYFNDILSAVNDIPKYFALSVRCLKDNPAASFKSCGDLLYVNHTTAKYVAPEAKQINYETVETDLSGVKKCWLKQNLGAANPASKVDDQSEAAAGWYWQFNRKQGYKSTGTALTPSWNSGIGSNSLNWQSTEDPCSIELGGKWRIPTAWEWKNARSLWLTHNDAFYSDLMLHTAGSIYDGVLTYRGSRAYYWSSARISNSTAQSLYFNTSGYIGESSRDKGTAQSIRCIYDETPVPFTTCGDNITVNHRTSNGVAPENSSISYGTVETSLSGVKQCWITKNLGASIPAIDPTDRIEEAAGWFWQFNRKQGYTSGISFPITPAWGSSVINENLNWQFANDPCAIELGEGWRIPTYMEWYNSLISVPDYVGGNYTTAFGSYLTLHAPGYLTTAGARSNTLYGYFWSSNLGTSTIGLGLQINSGNIAKLTIDKATGISIRCLKDIPIVPFTKCGDNLTIDHKAGNVAPATIRISYGTVSSSLSGSSKCWITQNLGATIPASSKTNSTEDAAGWFWQFNRKQGFLWGTPDWVGSTYTDNYDWFQENDPCMSELGAGWRVPTKGEWEQASAGWNGLKALESELHLRLSGYITNSSWSANNFEGRYWSSTSSSNDQAFQLYFTSTSSVMQLPGKTMATPIRCLKDLQSPTFTNCGDVFTVNHIKGPVALETIQINYGTVATNLTGTNQCWITQNLGAPSHLANATVYTDSGWFWQFNRKQGLSYGAWARQTNGESDSWSVLNDPCTLELGADWRIPSYSEWQAVEDNSKWRGYDDAYNSVLKLHAGGYLTNEGGLSCRPTMGVFWSSTSYSSDHSLAWRFLTYVDGIDVSPVDKTTANNLRCLRNITYAPTYTRCGDVLTIHHNTVNNVAPVTKTVNYQTVATNLSGDDKCWIAQNLGADKQALTVTDVTEAAAGWYWQFNRKRGYAWGPSPAWDTTPINAGDWAQSNDPCYNELGIDWRIPTSAEWEKAISNGKWFTTSDLYYSPLKMHTANYMTSNSGAYMSTSYLSRYWSSTQSISNASDGKYINASGSYASVSVADAYKNFGFPVRCISSQSIPPFSACGDLLTVAHKSADGFAADDKTIYYGTVRTNLSGSSKCWITQNLGASSPALQANDVNPEAAGWYWQFNRKRGHKNASDADWDSGSTWISSNWLADNDPCSHELGSGWRIPTKTELSNVNRGWFNYSDSFNSVLKIHAAGKINYSTKAIYNKGSYAYYWASTQKDAYYGWQLETWESGYGSSIISEYKANGNTIRCIHDDEPAPFTKCGDILTVNHRTNGIAPETKVIEYNTLKTTLTGSEQCWITQNLGASVHASKANDSNTEALGWYWRFNQKQGYDGKFSPAWTTQYTSLSANWERGNDPCAIELGSGWRIPTSAEWNAVKKGWGNYFDAYNSDLRLHMAGYINSDGTKYQVGSYGQYWSSTQSDINNGDALHLTSLVVQAAGKNYGHSIRCLYDKAPFVTTNAVSALTTTSVTLNGVLTWAGVPAATDYGFVLGDVYIPTPTIGSNLRKVTATATPFAINITGLLSGKQYYVRAYATNPNGTVYGATVGFVTLFGQCGDLLTVNHDPVRGVAPEKTTIYYGTVPFGRTDLSQPTKCWITQNLGASVQGSLVVDNSDAAAGWYWQFNRKQGYKANQSTLDYISESSNWTGGATGNDPCTLELGAGWRIPTKDEWFYASVGLQPEGLLSSGLRIRFAGYLRIGAYPNVWFVGRGSETQQWTSEQSNSQYGYANTMGGGGFSPNAFVDKFIGNSIRCLNDNIPIVTTNNVSALTTTSVTLNGVLTSPGVPAATDYGFVLGDASIPTPTIGSGSNLAKVPATATPFAITVTGLPSGKQYYVRTYATNANGTVYGATVGFVTLFGQCGDLLTVNHDPVRGVAPENKQIYYGTTQTNNENLNLCWITQNLGASAPASFEVDNSDDAAGWYWMFNIKKGFKYGTIPGSYTNSSATAGDWTPDNDPCSIELGTGWRIPSPLEWQAETQGWNMDIALSSSLHLRAAGSATSLSDRGVRGSYWSNKQYPEGSNIISHYLYMTSTEVSVALAGKVGGYSIRCVKELPDGPFINCGDYLKVEHNTLGQVAPRSVTIKYKTASVNTTGTEKCWIAQNLGATRQSYGTYDGSTEVLGWYWQFNRKKGYMSGNIPQFSSISEDKNWEDFNDPCNTELGNSWRIPTRTEWESVSSGWTGMSSAHSSDLRIYYAGYLDSNGSLKNTSSQWGYWSSTQSSLGGGNCLNYVNIMQWTPYSKISAFSLRCLSDGTLSITTNAVSALTATSVTLNGVLTSPGVPAATDYGFVLGDVSIPAPTIGPGSNLAKVQATATPFAITITGLPSSKQFYVRTYATNANDTVYGATVGFVTLFPCGSTLTVNHVAGAISPENVTIAYPTVSTDLTGTTKCWTLQNLGARSIAGSAFDASDAAAGWYWQYGRLQGYKHNGESGITGWISNITDSSWPIATDPCRQLLGPGWRIPTDTEWRNADLNGQVGGWDNYSEAWNDRLKLHSGGLLSYQNGSLYYRGNDPRFSELRCGNYWSNNETSVWPDQACFYSTGTTYSSTGNTNKATGLSVRCIKD